MKYFVFKSDVFKINLDIEDYLFLFPCLFFHCKYLYIAVQILQGNTFVKKPLYIKSFNYPFVIFTGKILENKHKYLSNTLFVSSNWKSACFFKK